MKEDSVDLNFNNFIMDKANDLRSDKKVMFENN